MIWTWTFKGRVHKIRASILDACEKETDAGNRKVPYNDDSTLTFDVCFDKERSRENTKSQIGSPKTSLHKERGMLNSCE